MQNTKILFLAVAITLGPFTWFLPSNGDAQVTVNCDAVPPQKIQDAINTSFPGGALIFVTGTCNENNIFIGGNRANLTLDGLPPGATTRATIFSQTPPGTPLPNINLAVNVNGASNVRIRNFHITSDGTADGVNIVDGANVRLQNNIIENMFREGVFVRAASARIFASTIQNNGGDGIVVAENSAVRIGFSSTDDGNVSPNTIQGNAGHGISVLRSSTARIVGNKPISPGISGGITDNGGHGISVLRGSDASIASNEISGNAGDGISVAENSGVNLGSAVGAGITSVAPVPPIFTEPNTTTEPNGDFGIRCSIGAYAHGDRGTLTGDRGAKRFDKTCINRLSRETKEKKEKEDDD